jgi:hypothetical protein
MATAIEARRKRVIVKREMPPFHVVEVLVRKQAEPERGGEHNAAAQQCANGDQLGSRGYVGSKRE